MPWTKRHFILGCRNVTIAVDHQPLLKIFGDRSLDNINTRLRNLKEKTLWYRFRMVHIPGVKNRFPDTLSRHPTGDTHPPKMVLHDDVHNIRDGSIIPIPTNLITGLCTNDQLHAIGMENQLQESLISSLPSTHTVHWKQVQVATSSDENMLLPEFKHQLPPPIREFHQFRGHLYSSDGVVHHHPTLFETYMPLHPTCRPSRHLGHDSKGRGINLLTGHHKRHTGHKRKLPTLQQDGSIPGSIITDTPHPTGILPPFFHPRI